ncbi:hypothetical protein CAC42_2456 [Sphaceloma murrayae]|uniref:RING-type domain-containing protein n=1 Tax=Sphaceloma murrayae TaxID=2082308 RepID=A0A2K1QW89_9PEZI|nr:hypothetical protein CAC42_2456 [Sphaceloma murrayae]
MFRSNTNHPSLSSGSQSDSDTLRSLLSDQERELDGPPWLARQALGRSTSPERALESAPHFSLPDTQFDLENHSSYPYLRTLPQGNPPPAPLGLPFLRRNPALAGSSNTYVQPRYAHAPPHLTPSHRSGTGDRQQHLFGDLLSDLDQDPRSANYPYEPSLTRAPDVMPSSAPRPRKRSGSATATSRPKRSRALDSAEVEEVNLTDDKEPMEVLLERERQELVQLQQGKENEEAPKPLGRINCIICMDNFTDLTATACGHLFCHECLTQALLAGERASDRNQGSCPVCRKTLKRTTKGHVIPLALMTRQTYQSSRHHLNRTST